jgi:hypothetical protein
LSHLHLLQLLHSQSIARGHSHRRENDCVRCEIQLIVDLKALHRRLVYFSALGDIRLELELNVVQENVQQLLRFRIDQGETNTDIGYLNVDIFLQSEKERRKSEGNEEKFKEIKENSKKLRKIQGN